MKFGWKNDPQWVAEMRIRADQKAKAAADKRSRETLMREMKQCEENSASILRNLGFKLGGK